MKKTPRELKKEKLRERNVREYNTGQEEQRGGGVLCTFFFFTFRFRGAYRAYVNLGKYLALCRCNPPLFLPFFGKFFFRWVDCSKFLTAPTAFFLLFYKGKIQSMNEIREEISERRVVTKKKAFVVFVLHYRDYNLRPRRAGKPRVVFISSFRSQGLPRREEGGKKA